MLKIQKCQVHLYWQYNSEVKCQITEKQTFTNVSEVTHGLFCMRRVGTLKLTAFLMTTGPILTFLSKVHVHGTRAERV